MKICYCDICNEKIECVREISFYEYDTTGDEIDTITKEVCENCFLAIKRLVDELTKSRQRGR